MALQQQSRRDDNVSERSELRALIDSLEMPMDSRVVRSGYGELSSFLQKRAAKR